MLAVALLLANIQGEPLAPLKLVCYGGGAANKLDTATAYASDNNGNAGSATVTRTRSQDFCDQVDLVVDEDRSRVRLPRSMLPPMHGGDAGWFKLKNVEVTSGFIRGSAAVNMINNPKVYVDRRTGSMTIDGKAGHYDGQCERAPSGDQPTKF